MDDYYEGGNIMVDSIRDRESLKADRRSGVLYLVIGLILLVLIFCVLASWDSNSLGSIIDAPSFIFVLALQLLPWHVVVNY